jgi:heat shock protein HtpX
VSLLRALAALTAVVLALLAGVDLFLQLSQLAIRLQQAGWPRGEVLRFVALLGTAGALLFWLGAPLMSRILLRVREVHQPRDSRELWLLASLRELALRADVPVPRLGIIDGSVLNAFTTGIDRRHTRIVLGRELLEQLEQDELEAVLAHELAHIQAGDMRGLALVQGAVSMLTVVPASLVARIPDRLLFGRKEGPVYYLLLIASQLAGGWLASLLASAFSRQCELRADRRAADLVGNDKMIAALRCLHAGHTEGHLPGMLLAFGITGRIGTGLAQMLVSHPSLGQRLHALQHKPA